MNRVIVFVDLIVVLTSLVIAGFILLWTKERLFKKGDKK